MNKTEVYIAPLFNPDYTVPINPSHIHEVVYIVPLFNPDGGENYDRSNAKDIGLNREILMYILVD